MNVFGRIRNMGFGSRGNAAVLDNDTDKKVVDKSQCICDNCSYKIECELKDYHPMLDARSGKDCFDMNKHMLTFTPMASGFCAVGQMAYNTKQGQVVVSDEKNWIGI